MQHVTTGTVTCNAIYVTIICYFTLSKWYPFIIFNRCFCSISCMFGWSDNLKFLLFALPRNSPKRCTAK